MTEDFDLQAMHAAIDAERQARRLTWTQVAREVNRAGLAPLWRPIATSTITGLSEKRVAEGDGVLQMLRWLGRPPESFTRGASAAELRAAALPQAKAGEVLRFDTRRLHGALDSRLRSLRMTWKDLSTETGVPLSHVRVLARGGRTTFPAVMRLTSWLRQPAARFVRASPV